MKNNMKYFLYARKSTDTEDKQVQSLDDQINVMTLKAKSLWINIVWTFIESKSAKAPWREEFNKMVSQIYEWKATWIIAWKLDRLSRNPIDTWTIQYMLQTWKIDKIITSDREYNPIDAWLLMSVETWMANQYILDLSKNVKRGMDSKTASWVFCWQVPEWYLNDKWNKTIIIDKKNFPIIKKAWKMMLTWNYTIPTLMKILNNEYKYKSNKKWRDKITMSWLYWIFKNIFYTWSFLWKWEIKPWTHKAMITFDEYEKVQEILWRKWLKVRPKNLEFAYSGIMRCWECWSAIVWTQKTKKIKSTWEVKTYTYYHCSKRKKWCTCGQKRITLSELELQINNLLENIEIIPEFREIAIDIIRENYKNEVTSNNSIKNSLNKTLKENENRLEKLVDFLIDWKLDDDTYEAKKKETQDNISILKWKISNLDSNKLNIIQLTEDTFNFVNLIKEKFDNADLKGKKLILTSLGENFVLFNWEMALDIHSWLQPIENKLPEIKRIYKGLEPTKNSISLRKTDATNPYILLWSEGPGLNWHTQGLKP